jgi:hypothetical protein
VEKKEFFPSHQSYALGHQSDVFYHQSNELCHHSDILYHHKDILYHRNVVLDHDHDHDAFYHVCDELDHDYCTDTPQDKTDSYWPNGVAFVEVLVGHKENLEAPVVVVAIDIPH